MRIVLVLCLLLVTYTLPASAEISDIKKDISQRELDSWKRQIPRYTQQYDKILSGLYKNSQQIEQKLRLLRSYYVGTQQYSPFSRPILDKIAKYAMVLDTETDNVVINDALMSYRTLLDKHLMNLDVASFALTMSRIDVRFGDEIFYKKIRDALIKSFNGKNLGLKPERAYNIVSYGEETYILEQLSSKIEHSKIYGINRKYYNVHDIITKEGKQLQIFMDITQPIRNILYSKIIEEQENKIDIKIH